MRNVPNEFLRLLSSLLKLGEREKPVYRVEVDRMAFIPGRVEELQYFYTFTEEQKKVLKSYINPDGDGRTLINSQKMVFPAEGFTLEEVSSPFGNRQDHYHKGIDIGCPMKTPIKAVADGEVVVVSMKEKYTSWGYYIDIKHPGGAVTRYAHLSHIYVTQGSVVKAGDIIALSGNTGNVRSGGYPVEGTYEDASSPRALGAGAHLHFELLLDSKQVDPYPYLKGEKSIYTTAVNVGDVINEGEAMLTTTGVLFEEDFSDKNWLAKPQYVAYNSNFKDIIQIEYTQPSETNTGNLAINFSDDSITETDFSINLNLSSPALLEVSFCSDFAVGSEFSVYTGIEQRVKIDQFNGLGYFQTVSGVYIPSGDITVRFVVKCQVGHPKKFIIDYFKFYSTVEDRSGDPGYWYQQEVSNPVQHYVKEKKPISVGNFVYMDTVTLDNVVRVEWDREYEADCSEARVTITNPNGIYGPDFSPWRFPEVGSFDTRFSYEINGIRIGLLSENTPVRIYEGYGLNYIRVFTGLIDKVDINSQDGTLTFSCRDMYKKILEKTLTENKSYPDDLGDDHMLDTSPPASYTGLDRYNKIVYNAQKYASQYNVDANLILAIAKHETNYGTLGAGREEAGSYICGYGVPDSGKVLSQYAGIEMQCKMVAMRIRDALGDRPVNQATIQYLWNGGDLKSEFRYSSDPNWPNSVWACYQEIVASPPEQLYTGTAAGVDNTYSDLQEKLKTGSAMWLKSAIVHDLVAHAKMFGWRAAADDLFYPDVVIEESYLIEVNQATGKVIKAGSQEGEFIVEDLQSVPTVHGWMNPFCEYGRVFNAFQTKIGDAIKEVIKDTNYRSYCDRYGTYRLEHIRFDTPVVGMFTEGNDLVTISKTIDWSKGRSHIAVIGTYDGGIEHFIDKEILAELKGEIRTAVVLSPWAKTRAQKEEIAKRMFWDMKRLCRTLQVGIPGRPELDVLDRIYVVDKTTGTRDIYCIKGIRSTNDADDGYSMILDLFWCEDEALYR